MAGHGERWRCPPRARGDSGKEHSSEDFAASPRFIDAFPAFLAASGKPILCAPSYRIERVALEHHGDVASWIPGRFTRIVDAMLPALISRGREHAQEVDSAADGPTSHEFASRYRRDPRPAYFRILP